MNFEEKLKAKYEKLVSQNKALKPCPRCGSTAEISRTSGSYGYYPPTVFPMCTNKCCKIRGPAYSTEKWDEDRGHYSVESEAIYNCIEWWNYRVC